MAKEETIKFEGDIIDVMPSATFKVKLDTGNIVIAYISGKMRKNEIRILMGDRVEIELSLYDLTRGRITRRK